MARSLSQYILPNFWLPGLGRGNGGHQKGMPKPDRTEMRLDLSRCVLIVEAADAEAIQVSRQDRFGARRLDAQARQSIGAGTYDIVVQQEIDLVAGDHRRQ